MTTKLAEPPADARFLVVRADDLFHSIVRSRPIVDPGHPAAFTVVTLFVVRRASGTFDLVLLHRTQSGDGISREAAQNAGLTRDVVDAEVERTLASVATTINAKTGCDVIWDTLDLRDLWTRDGQLARIEAWGGLSVYDDCG